MSLVQIIPSTMSSINLVALSPTPSRHPYLPACDNSTGSMIKYTVWLFLRSTLKLEFSYATLSCWPLKMRFCSCSVLNLVQRNGPVEFIGMEQFMMAVPPATTAMFSGDTATSDSAPDPEMINDTRLLWSFHSLLNNCRLLTREFTNSKAFAYYLPTTWKLIGPLSIICLGGLANKKLATTT